MVLTVAMPWGWGRTGRRTFIAAATGVVGVALVGCDLAGDEPAAIPAADAAALRQVAGESLDLANRYDAAISQSPDQAAKLTPIRDAHREHAAAIGRSLDTSVTAAAPTASASTGSGSGLKALAAAEKAAAERAAAACVAAASHYAPLLGTVAAARASHAEVL
jgi:hypothetical protein